MVIGTLFLFVLSLLLQGSCAGSPAKKTSVAHDPVYTPKKVFALDYPSAWEGILQALKGKNIPVILEEKEKGIIRTDYQEGPNMYRLGRTSLSRYKYAIFLFKETEERTILNVRCFFEIQGIDGKTYSDANWITPQEVVSREKELYKIIESSLAPLEASRPVSPKVEEKPPTPGGQPPLNPPSPAEPAKQETLTSPVPPPTPPPQGKTRLTYSPAPKESASLSSQVGTASPPRSEHRIFLITKKTAGLLEEPSPRSKIILTLKEGSRVEKIGESGEWVKVKIWGKTIGWISKDLIQEAGVSESER